MAKEIKWTQTFVSMQEPIVQAPTYLVVKLAVKFMILNKDAIQSHH